MSSRIYCVFGGSNLDSGNIEQPDILEVSISRRGIISGVTKHPPPN